MVAQIIKHTVDNTVFDEKTGDFLQEKTEGGEEIKLLRGGKGGLSKWQSTLPLTNAEI